MTRHGSYAPLPPQTTTSPSDVQSDSALGIALGKLAIAASDYYQVLMGTDTIPVRAWSQARAHVLSAALAVGQAVEQEVRQVADQHRDWPVTRTGDKAMP